MTPGDTDGVTVAPGDTDGATVAAGAVGATVAGWTPFPCPAPGALVA